MRLLCLHGLGTNSDVFKAQLGQMAQNGKSAQANFSEPIIRALVSVEFIFVDALIECPGDVEIAKFYRGPFFRHWDGSRKSVHECYEDILDIVDEDGPFDGVVGFSQGAAAAATALLYSQSLDNTAPPLFKFAIFFCATSALNAADSSHEVPAAKNVLLPPIPTVHVVGQEDNVREQSMALHELADQQYARLITHEGGHWIPKDTVFARKMQDAIEWAVLASGGGG
jgi:hypothetical protein